MTQGTDALELAQEARKLRDKAAEFSKCHGNKDFQAFANCIDEALHDCSIEHFHNIECEDERSDYAEHNTMNHATLGIR